MVLFRLTEDTSDDFGGLDTGGFLVETLEAEGEPIVVHAEAA